MCVCESYDFECTNLTSTPLCLYYNFYSKYGTNALSKFSPDTELVLYPLQDKLTSGDKSLNLSAFKLSRLFLSLLSSGTCGKNDEWTCGKNNEWTCRKRHVITCMQRAFDNIVISPGPGSPACPANIGSTVVKRDEKERQKPKQRNLAMPSIGRHLKVNEVLKKKKDEDEAKRLADEEAAAKAKEEAADKSREEEDDSKDEENAEDNVDVNQVFNKIQNMPFLNTSTKSKKKAAEKEQKTNTNKRKIEEVEYEQPEKKKTNKKKMKCMKNYSRKTGRQQKINIQESDSEDNNTASEGENDDDVEIQSKQEVLYMGSEEVEEASDSENEVLNAGKGKKGETMKKKTEAYNSKKLRNNRSEEEEQTNRNQKRMLRRLKKKKCLKEIGFERYIHFPIVELPSTLAYHVIDKFHTSSMELRLEKGSIKVTRQKIHEILGIPMGETKLEDLNERPSNDPFIKEWKAQYSHLGKPTPPAIASRINSTKDTDFMFKMNFITLFGSTMGTLENGRRVPIKLLKYIKEDDDIAEIDWCSYIFECLRTNLNIIRHTPAIRSWNTLMMKKMIDLEKSERCLGNLEHHGEFDPEEEQHGIDVYKGLDVYKEALKDRTPTTKEEFYETIIAKFDNLIEEKVKLVEYEYDMNEDKEDENDEDNDNNMNDDEGEPMEEENMQTENEKQMENEATNDGEEDEDDVDNETEFDKMSRKDDEAAVSMQVDESNEHMKEKKTKKEKVTEKNDMKNDSIQKEHQIESEKEKQHEDDKVEKVNSKDDDSLELSESQYEQFETRETSESEHTPKEKEEKVEKREKNLQDFLFLHTSTRKHLSKDKQKLMKITMNNQYKPANYLVFCIYLTISNHI
ncbi:hypothetical protein Tco_1505377 [Tanacetum coccineum]